MVQIIMTLMSNYTKWFNELCTASLSVHVMVKHLPPYDTNLCCPQEQIFPVHYNKVVLRHPGLRPLAISVDSPAWHPHLYKSIIGCRIWISWDNLSMWTLMVAAIVILYNFELHHK